MSHLVSWVGPRPTEETRPGPGNLCGQRAPQAGVRQAPETRRWDGGLGPQRGENMA